ncbi:transmembrane protein PVRIG isoform X3 [Lutra lutra]|uniref:transmembrane protein PVRIG isoform X3 n=1 Tax=Lutra lutra TaxID=9657 RepID=UPI001FD590DA|nr:transmembrane protein PVRIG isoform X3 [Lutra lutra]
MDRARAPVLLSVLLTFCITAGTPEVWVQVQMEAAASPSFSVRCGFLGSGSISLVTVSSGGPDGAGGTRLAVLHPEFGIQQWSPARRAHWETKTSISLAVEEGSEGRSPGANTTFCCKFVSFPEGSQEACGSLFLRTDQGGVEERGRGAGEGRQGCSQPSGMPLCLYPGLPAPTPAPMLRADLAGIFGVSGVLLFGCVYLLHLLHRQRHWSVSKAQPPLTSPQPQAAGQAPLVSLRAPCTAVTASRYCPAALDLVLPRQLLARWAPLPASTRSSFVSMENGLYAQAGERPFQAGPNLVPFPDSLGHRAAEGHLGVR